MYEEIDMPAPRLSDPAIYESQPQHLKASINRARFFWRWDTPEKYQTNLRAYFRMLTGIDRVIGRVLKRLSAEGLADNTIVVYSADNGYYMGDRGFAGKWSHYEQSLRVPLVIRDPRLPEKFRRRVVEPMALNLDLPATFLDWAGVDIPASYQGRSLRPIVEGRAVSDWRKDFFCEHVILAPTLTWEGVRGERYVYARYFDQKPL
jgi:arylsulfatase A-like enzyme